MLTHFPPSKTWDASAHEVQTGSFPSLKAHVAQLLGQLEQTPFPLSKVEVGQTPTQRAPSGALGSNKASVSQTEQAGGLGELDPSNENPGIAATLQRRGAGSHIFLAEL